MPVFPVVLAPGASYSDYDVKYARTGEVLYTGCVLLQGHREVRVMSDVYSETYYVLVWNPETKETFTVNLYTIGFGSSNEAEVDATPEVLAAWAAYRAEKAAQAARADYARRCEDARLRLLVPKLGCPAKVVKGRNVPIGTEGLVTWEGDMRFGFRVGITDSSGKLHYTNSSNVVRVVEQAEGEDWVTTERRLYAAPACKWDAVRITTGKDAGVEGTVFYVNGDKIGITTSNKKVDGRYVDVVWSFIPAVTVIEARNGKEPHATNTVTAAPRKPVVAPF